MRGLEDWVFVLQPIDDPDERDKLAAEYYIVELSPPLLMYCLPDKPGELGFPNVNYAVMSDDAEYCFDVPHWYE